jgi:hypothetical protein
MVEFSIPTEWSPSSPDLNPLEYHVVDEHKQLV